MFDRRFTLPDGRVFQVRKTSRGWEVESPQKKIYSFPTFSAPTLRNGDFSTLLWQGQEAMAMLARGKSRVISWCGGSLELESDPLLDGEGEGGPRAKTVKVTMPGKVLEVRVKPGQRVLTGECLVVVEAMKMENLIVAPSAAVVAEVNVKVGDRIDAGAVLLKFAEE